MSRFYFKVGLVMVSSLFLFACGGKKKEDPTNATVPVNLYKVQPEHVTFYDQYPATVVAMMQVDIHPEVEGYVTGIFFTEGQHVKKGQKLYTIDDAKYRATYDQAEAGLRSAYSNLDRAQKDADRYIYLDKHDAVAKQLLDHALTSLQMAKDSITSAKQTLARAKTDLDYAVIRAPFDGTIGISQVKIGNTVTIGTTVLNTISSDDPMAVDFVINEKQIPRFVKLQQQRHNPVDSLFTLMMPNNVLYGQLGEIYVIDRGVDPQTGTIRVRLKFPNPDFMLRAGMSCMARVHNEDTALQLVIPSKATVEQMGEYFVYIAKDTLIASADTTKKEKEKGADEEKGPSLHAIQVKVVLGQTIADKVIVKSGLKTGDSVITDGVQKLHDGSPITTANNAGPAAQGKGK